MYITIINILIFIISIAIAIVIIIIIIIIKLLLLFSPLVLLSYSLNPHDGYVKSDNCLLQFLCHMGSEVKFSLMLFLFTFSLFKSYDILWIKISWTI